jgi:hypothetical protein
MQNEQNQSLSQVRIRTSTLVMFKVDMLASQAREPNKHLSTRLRLCAFALAPGFVPGAFGGCAGRYPFHACHPGLATSSLDSRFWRRLLTRLS